MQTLNRTFRVLVTALVAASCSDHVLTQPQQELASPGGACSGKIDVQVSFATSGKTPSFDWTPRCGVSALLIQTVPFMGAAPAMVWGFSAPESNPVKPVIEYSVLPRGATQRLGPANLVQGVTYRVIVDQTLGLDASVAHGDKTFTIP
jgi:hypothetical protein